MLMLMHCFQHFIILKVMIFIITIITIITTTTTIILMIVAIAIPFTLIITQRMEMKCLTHGSFRVSLPLRCRVRLRESGKDRSTRRT